MTNQSQIQVGTPGNDILRVSNRGNIGNIQIGNGGSDRIIGSDENDVLISGDAVRQTPAPPVPSVAPAPSAATAALVSSTPVTINGTPENDTLTGSDQSEIFTGGKGADTLSGESGDDTFIWNPGDGSDIVHGGPGKDTSIVNGTPDSEISTLSSVDGKAVFDRLSQAPFKITHDRTGQIQLNAGAGNDFSAIQNLDGSGVKTVTFDGGDGNDVLFGGASAIDVSASGGVGDDTLIGGHGNNTLNGGVGNDSLVGTGGSNQFLFGSGKPFNTVELGNDAISGFDLTKDKIVLSKATFDAIGSHPGTGIGAADFARVDSDEAAALSTAKVTYIAPTGSSVGRLVYNANGAEAGFGNGAQFATIAGTPTLSDQSFAMVA